MRTPRGDGGRDGCCVHTAWSTSDCQQVLDSGAQGGLSGSASRAPSCSTLATDLRLQRDSMEGTCQVTGATQSLAVMAACVG